MKSYADKAGNHCGSADFISALDPTWKQVMRFYEPMDFIGKGSFGQVIKAKSKATGNIVAIKLIKDLFKNADYSLYVLRELTLLHELTCMPDNIFTVKLLDVIIDAQSSKDLGSFSNIFLVMEFIEQDL